MGRRRKVLWCLKYSMAICEVVVRALLPPVGPHGWAETALRCSGGLSHSPGLKAVAHWSSLCVAISADAADAAAASVTKLSLSLLSPDRRCSLELYDKRQSEAPFGFELELTTEKINRVVMIHVLILYGCTVWNLSQMCADLLAVTHFCCHVMWPYFKGTHHFNQTAWRYEANGRSPKQFFVLRLKSETYWREPPETVKAS